MYHSRSVRVLVATAIASLVMTSVALADNAISDGDGAVPVVDSNLSLGPVGCNALVPDTALIAINRNGSATGTNTFANNAVVTVSVLSVTPGVGLSATIPTASNANKITLPSNWTGLANNTRSEGTVTANVSLTSSTEGAGSGTITFRATGLNTSGATINRDDDMTVSWTTGTCAPPNTPPSVSVTGVTDGLTYEFGAVPAATCNVIDTEDGNSSFAATLSAVTGPLSTYGLGIQTASYSYTDDGGLSDSDSATYTIVDTGAPAITDAGPTAGPTGNNGWYIVAVTNTFTATDSGAGFLAPLTNPHNFNVSSGTVEGSAVKINSGTVQDVAGNTATAIDSAAFKIDLTDPENAVTGVATGGTYTLGSVPAAGCTTTDPGSDPSGVASSASVSVTGGTSNGVGTFTATCSGGADNAGRLASNATATYQVNFGGLSGILQPINSDNTSVFNRGKSVPVKFRLAGDEPSGFDFSGWTLRNQQVSCTNFDSIDAELEPIVENPSNAFRYDAVADQYIYNANFKSMAVGTCWKVVVSLDSGQTMTSAIFRLQK